MSKKVSIRYLIDVAIGNPEPGIVNFNALYTVLQAISEKLDIEDDQVEIDSSFCPVPTYAFDSKSIVSSERLMHHQVYENPPEEQRVLSYRSRNSTQAKKKQHQRSVSLPNEQIAEDRKVAFGHQSKKNDNGEGSSQHLGKKPKDLDIRQQIDFLCERLEKIENFAVWSVDTEQSVECLRQIVQQLQGKMESFERSICEIKDKQYNRGEDISACRNKLEYDKLARVTDDLRKDLNFLKESINGSGSEKMQIKKTLAESSNNSEIARLNDQLIELKTSFCVFNEKMRSLQEVIAKIDTDSLIVKLDLFQNEISSLKAQAEDSTLQTEYQNLKELTDKLDEEIHSKIDKAEVDELLSEKVDYCMLHEKVSVEIMDAEHRKFEKQLSEITDCVLFNEEQVQKQIDDIKKLIGDENLKDLMHEFELKINKDFQRIFNDIKRLAAIKPDVDSAVTRLRDLTCLSCDQDVVMKAVEVNNLSKFNDAHVSKSISPSIAFEVSKLRETGKIGVFNDDDILFQLEKKFRHCGGIHTIITKKDIIKTKLRKNK